MGGQILFDFREVVSIVVDRQRTTVRKFGGDPESSSQSFDSFPHSFQGISPRLEEKFRPVFIGQRSQFGLKLRRFPGIVVGFQQLREKFLLGFQGSGLPTHGLLFFRG
jgi:hypothetical protein